MREQDEIAFTTSYKLYRMKETWAGAEAHCKSEGGHLASGHSSNQQALAEKSYGWLGGRMAEGSAEWRWSDNSTWDFTNWQSGSGNIEDRCLYMKYGGKWQDQSCTIPLYFLCQQDIAITKETGFTRFEMGEDQMMKFSPFYITFKSKALDKQMTNSLAEEKKMTGFTLNWFMEDKNGQLI